MTLAQGDGCGVDKQKFPCLRDKVRTTHRITTNRTRNVALVMVITWLDFEGIRLNTVILANFLKNFRMCFFKVKHYFCHISGMLDTIDVKRKGSALGGYWVQYVTLTFGLTHVLDRGCFMVKFLNSSISGIVGLIDVKLKKEVSWYDTGPIVRPCPLTPPITLALEFQGQSLK